MGSQPGLSVARADGGSDGGSGGGVGIDLTPLLRWLLTPAGLITVAVLLILLVVAIMVVGLLVRRAIRRRLPAGRLLVQRATLGWRAQTLPPGPHRQLAELRARLEDALAATDHRAGEDPALPVTAGSLSGLAGRLDRAGQALAEQLAGLQREPDQTRLTAALPVVEQQVGEWCAAAASVRAAERSADLEASAGQLDEL